MDIKTNTIKYYLHSALFEAKFYGPVYVLFFQRFNLSLTQILFFLSVYGVTTLFFEIPTGVLSDYIGRKRTLIISSLILFITFLLFAFSDSYLLFIIAYILMAVAWAFESGTSESLIYDTLTETKNVKDFKKIQGVKFFLTNLMVVLSFLAGGFLFKINFRLPYIVTSIMIFFALIISLTFKEPKRTMPKKSHLIHTKESIKFLAKHHYLRNLTLFSVLISTAMVLMYFLNQPYFKFIKLPVEMFGIVLGIAAALGAIFSKYAYKIEEKLGEKTLMYLIPISIILSYGLMGIFSFKFAFIFYYFLSFSGGLYGPILSDYFNKNIKSYNRATVLSIKSALMNLSFFIFAPIAGYLSDTISLQTTFIIIAIAVFVLSLILLVNIFKNKNNCFLKQKKDL